MGGWCRCVQPLPPPHTYKPTLGDTGWHMNRAGSKHICDVPPPPLNGHLSLPRMALHLGKPWHHPDFRLR